MKRIGFTGTRHGMTDKQRAVLEAMLSLIGPFEGHHGDCMGADAQFHESSRKLGARVVVHPPPVMDWRAGCAGDVILPTLPYLTRNQAIVNACDELIATPFESCESNRGGTWHALRFARKMKKPHTIIWPDGTVLVGQ